VAIFPEVGLTDQYALLWHGGIFHHGLIEGWTDRIKKIDIKTPAPPVDGPEGEALLRTALADHRNNVDMAALAGGLPFRDSVDPKTGIRPWLEWSPITYRKEIERSGVAIYHLAGWFDRYVLGQIVLYKNLGNPQRITIGPWSHVQDHELDSGAEHHRFYDYWLKGIDNGITQEDPVHYYVMGSGWRSARQWPLPDEKRTWVSADVADADLFVYLEEVDAKGASHYVTEGALRASHRAKADPGYDYLGMPWHRSFAADASPLPKGKPVELAFDLFPTSNLFDAGHRIRVTVTGADRANATTPEQTPPPRLILHREDGRASHIVLPIIPAR